MRGVGLKGRGRVWEAVGPISYVTHIIGIPHPALPHGEGGEFGRYTGNAVLYATCFSAKLDLIFAMPGTLVRWSTMKRS